MQGKKMKRIWSTLFALGLQILLPASLLHCLPDPTEGCLTAVSLQALDICSILFILCSDSHHFPKFFCQQLITWLPLKDKWPGPQSLNFGTGIFRNIISKNLTFLFSWNDLSMGIRKQKIKMHWNISKQIFQYCLLLAARFQKVWR